MRSRTLLLLHPDDTVHAHVRKAAGTTFAVREMRSWARLTEALLAAPLTSLAVVDPYGADGRLATELREMLQSFPCASVVAVVRGHRCTAADLRTMGAWGVTEVVADDEEGVKELAGVLSAARTMPLRDLIESRLPPHVLPQARAVLFAAAEVALTHGAATHLARALHVSMRTLVRLCARARLPNPRNLLGWMRVLLAAQLLENRVRSVDAVARACGYASDSGLRRALRDFLRSNARALREAGPFAVASTAFLRVLSGGGGSVHSAPLPGCLRHGRAPPDAVPPPSARSAPPSPRRR